MHCPKCDGPSKVTDTRSPRRERQCKSCYYHWETIEIPLNQYQNDVLLSGIAWQRTMDIAIEKLQEKKHETKN